MIVLWRTLQAQLRHFPWRVYLRFVLGQFLALALVFSGFAWVLHRYLEDLLQNYEGASDLLLAFDELLALACLSALVLSTLFSLWIGRRFFLPLGKLIIKARGLNVRRPPRNSEAPTSPQSIGEEWQELDAVLDRIEGDLRRTSDRLSKGRQEINALMGAISEAILAVDVSGQAVFFNEQFSKLFGGDEIKHEQNRMPRLTEIFRMPDILDAFQQAVHTGETVNLNTSVQVRTDAEVRDYQLSVSPLRTRDNQEVYGALGIFHDISELKKAERIRIEFVGNASHELRTPLTSIKGYLDTLRDDFRKGRYEGADRFFDIIARNVDRLTALVADLLDLSSMEGQGGTLNRELLETRDVTESVLRSLEKESQPRGQVINTYYGVDQVWADQRKLEQVLTNLIYNAIKYIPQGKTIDVTWEKAPSGGVLLHVEDNGPGIAKKHLPRLFERFYRVDEGRSREVGGTGLGLAIVKHICLRHGGWVKAESELGQGTQFTCYLPE